MKNTKIVYEDSDILILNKDAGITVNKSDTTRGEHTVQDFLEEKLRLNDTSCDNSSDFFKRAGIVHRLDKETSGILIAAKTPDAFLNLQKQFKERKVKKTYIALAHGKMLEENGEIRVPVGRLPWNRKRFGVLAGGREALTKYKVLEALEVKIKNSREILTLLELFPETGRTHQIRVHLKYINRPIFSDYLYAGRKTARDDRKILPRVFLHAKKISFFHPVTKKLVSFEAQIPEELTEVLKFYGFKQVIFASIK